MQAIIRPPAKHHLNGVSLVARQWPNIECLLSSFVIFQAIWTSIDNCSFADEEICNCLHLTMMKFARSNIKLRALLVEFELHSLSSLHH